MDIQEQVSLKPYNTFGVEVSARYFCNIESLSDVAELVKNPIFLENPRLFIGGGSNILFTKNFDGIVVKNSLRGIEILNENEKTVTVQVASGEVWHDFVLWAVQKGYGGIENLALIPGTVGGAPMQNIGAYGVEVKKVIQSVQAIQVGNGELKTFSYEECQFGYRTSIFKTTYKDQYFITGMTCVLTKTGNHILATEYGSIQDELVKKNITAPTIKDIADIVSEIRSNKLPQPEVIGNAGSFFKNPEVPESKLVELQKSFIDMPSYPTENGLVKIPAGYLIEQAGWKGKRVGNVGVHEKQALVLVNYGGGTGAELLTVAEAVKKDVKEKFDISLETEVWIY